MWTWKLNKLFLPQINFLHDSNSDPNTDSQGPSRFRGEWCYDLCTGGCTAPGVSRFTISAERRPKEEAVAHLGLIFSRRLMEMSPKSVRP